MRSFLTTRNCVTAGLIELKFAKLEVSCSTHSETFLFILENVVHVVPVDLF
jgi:hypothetical protein